MSAVNDAPLIIDNIRPGGTRPAETPARADRTKPAAEDEASFWDVLDIINPLQHIPIVSTIYREITGDTIKPLARLAGGALFGGLVGVGMAAVSATAEGIMGLDQGETMVSFLFGDDGNGTRPPVEAGTEIARQAVGVAPEGRESPAQMIARYARPLQDRAQTAAAPVSAGALMPSSAVPFMALDTPNTTAGTTPTRPAASAFAAARQAVENGPAPGVAPPAGVMPAMAAALKGPETADRSKETATARTDRRQPDAIQSALEAQGLGPEAASHPMIQALAAGRTAAPAPPLAGQGPQQVPGWFDQAMTRALDRYEQTGRLNRPAATHPTSGADI